MRAFAATTQLQERWWEKHTELVSGGPLQYPMLKTSCGDAKTANSSESNLMSRLTVSSPYRQVERMNGMIIEGLKKRLYDENSKKGRKWIHELPHVVWGLRTQPSKATGQTPFFLVYGSEAILPADIMWKSPRVKMYNEGEADEARQLELDSVKVARCTALV
jgi:hypothetical protein